MIAADKASYSLAGIMPVVPCFDFFDLAEIQVPAPWQYMEAMYAYEADIRPLARDWADARGQEIWERNKPWYCSL